MTKLRDVQISLVVVANDHNPTILNPDFLQIQKIIPASWGWKLVGLPVTTPPFAVVKYDSGITISVEPNKLQVIDEKSQNIKGSHIGEIVTNYVKVLPHVRYIAVGNNIKAVIEIDNVSDYITNNFIKSGPWSKDLQTADLKFVYPTSDGVCILSLEGAFKDEVESGEKKQRTALLVGANFHRACTSEKPSHEQVIQFVSHLNNDWDSFHKILKNTLGLQ